MPEQLASPSDIAFSVLVQRIGEDKALPQPVKDAFLADISASSPEKLERTKSLIEGEPNQ